ncbi:MAG: diol dehydratase small subunit [Bacillota bacterium]
MNQEQLIQAVVKEVLASMGGIPAKASATGGVTKAQYPLGEKIPEKVLTPTGKKLTELTLDKVISGEVTAEDVRIAPETLEMQAQVAESVHRDAFAGNLRRAAELIAVPDERLLEIYNALRPYRSTKSELYAIADELKGYGADICAAFVREAADVYEVRGRLKKD